MTHYERLTDSSTHEEPNILHEEGTEIINLSETRNPIQIIGKENELHVRVLNKEAVVEISGLSSTTGTVLDLKLEIERKTTIIPDHQRLIFSGKALKPDEALLSSFHIVNDSSIHLFPKPPNMPSSSDSNNPNNITNTMANSNMTSQSSSLSRQPIAIDLTYDTTISHSASEVRLWSSILIFSSVMSLFDNFNRVVSTGTFGETIFDSLVNMAETGCSIGGIYVGQMGLNSVQTYDLETVQKYVKALTILAVCSMMNRFFWVADYVLIVKQLLKEKHENQKDTTNNTTGDSTETHPISDSKILLTYEIQAVLIATVCLAAWFNCVVRAHRFRNDVTSYRGSNNIRSPV